MLRPRRSAPPDGSQWAVSYGLPHLTERPYQVITELFDTKAQARERIFTVRKFKGVTFVELREPGGALWFRDHFFADNPGGMK